MIVQDSSLSVISDDFSREIRSIVRKGFEHPEYFVDKISDLVGHTNVGV